MPPRKRKPIVVAEVGVACEDVTIALLIQNRTIQSVCLIMAACYGVDEDPYRVGIVCNAMLHRSNAESPLWRATGSELFTGLHQFDPVAEGIIHVRPLVAF